LRTAFFKAAALDKTVKKNPIVCPLGIYQMLLKRFLSVKDTTVTVKVKHFFTKKQVGF
jgi:hypothetical protein